MLQHHAEIVELIKKMKPMELTSWVAAPAIISLPAWLDALRDLSLFAALIASIFGIVLTAYLIRESRLRYRLLQKREDDFIP